MDNIIRCPHCGKEFEISRESYAEIKEHVRNREFAAELEQFKEIYREDLKNKYESLLSAKDREIQFYKELKTSLSTKMVGETLEQHCMNQFNSIRTAAFPNAYFEKDNEAVDNTKGDFIYREEIDGTELLSIMFEMKNESDSIGKKKKNEDFFDKLDKDRIKKKCEYAVLVTLLEKDSDLYNQGIVDVSYRYPKMYVIRPQLFIPMITLLRNAALNSFEARKKLAEFERENFDVYAFEEQFEIFKNKFSANYESSQSHYEKAIQQIDKAIDMLSAVKDSLQTSNNQLRLANDKAQKMTAKKLAKNSPSIKAQLKHKPTPAKAGE